MKSFLIKLFLGKKEKYFDFMSIKGKVYKVDIQPYESIEELLKRAANYGVFCGSKH